MLKLGDLFIDELNDSQLLVKLTLLLSQLFGLVSQLSSHLFKLLFNLLQAEGQILRALPLPLSVLNSSS